MQRGEGVFVCVCVCGCGGREGRVEGGYGCGCGGQLPPRLKVNIQKGTF